MDKTFKGRSLSQSFDWKLVIMYLLLVFIGWMNIYASIHSSDPSSILDWNFRCGKQFVWILTAFGLASLILFVLPSRLWETGSIIMYMGVLVLLVAVIFLGTETKGSHSWFEFGPVKFQPAEVSKITTSLVLAFIMSRSNYKISNIKDFLITLAIIGLPFLVILAESETGSALVYVGFVFMLYREGLSGWFIVLIGMTILLFILTLTTSTYTAVAVLLSAILLFNAANARRSMHWLLIFIGIILGVALFPWLWNSILETMVPGASVIKDVDPMVADAIRYSARAPWMLRIRPLYILLLVAFGFMPYLLRKSYIEKNTFIGLSVLAFLAGLFLSYSTEFIFNDVLQDHQRSRIEVLLGMKEDLAGVGYNVHQSMIAIGSGGFFGKGFLNGTQTTYGFVPEQSTDFIFCTVGEEWGFVGCFVVILLYALLISRIIRDAESCREHFTRIYGYCVAGCFFMHLFINVGMTVGLMPVIGIPLPLMSYGGSSLWSFTVLLFIFIALHHEEKKYF
ncbi:MAG: rod shape-determining protein RodA [Bacteroidales bacterium]|nr:rod shape-determining protein RodA [Bacteroidales bacterium]